MVKRIVVVLGVILVLGSVAAWAQRRPISPDSPFFTPDLDLSQLVKDVRAAFGIKPIVISATNPFDTRYIQFLWLLGFNTNALAQLYEVLAEKSIVTLRELSQISYFGSSRALFKILVFFSFPDEGSVKLQEEAPEWWAVFPWPFMGR